MGNAGKYAIAALLGANLGLFGGGYLNRHAVEPVSAYMMDVNGDGINDIVARGPTSHRTVLIGQKDGTFKRLDIVTDAQKDSIDTMVREIEAKAK